MEAKKQIARGSVAGGKGSNRKASRKRGSNFKHRHGHGPPLYVNVGGSSRLETTTVTFSDGTICTCVHRVTKYDHDIESTPKKRESDANKTLERLEKRYGHMPRKITVVPDAKDVTKYDHHIESTPKKKESMSSSDAKGGHLDGNKSGSPP